MELTDGHRERLRALLERERRRLQASLDSLRRAWEDAETGGIGELSTYDQHPADLGSELAARQVDLGLAQNEARLLAQVESALERLDEGTYGICEQCGRPIPVGRLFAMPSATRCARCAAGEDAGGDGHPGGVGRTRPPEEELLAPPFGRTSGDGPAYDGEDAWRDVAEYGTSNSPQDDPEAARENTTGVPTERGRRL